MKRLILTAAAVLISALTVWAQPAVKHPPRHHNKHHIPRHHPHHDRGLTPDLAPALDLMLHSFAWGWFCCSLRPLPSLSL